MLQTLQHVFVGMKNSQHVQVFVVENIHQTNTCSCSSSVHTDVSEIAED